MRRTAEAETMLRKLRAGRKFGLRTNRREIDYQDCHGTRSDGIGRSPFREISLHVYLNSINLEKHVDDKMSRSSRAPWAASGPLGGAMDQLKNSRLRIHLYDATFLSALYTAEN